MTLHERADGYVRHRHAVGQGPRLNTVEPRANAIGSLVPAKKFARLGSIGQTLSSATHLQAVPNHYQSITLFDVRLYTVYSGKYGGQLPEITLQRMSFWQTEIYTLIMKNYASNVQILDLHKHTYNSCNARYNKQHAVADSGNQS